MLCSADLVLDMNKVDLVYKNILIENDIEKTDLARDYKRKLKEVIEDYVSNAAFVKSKHKNTHEQIITKTDKQMRTSKTSENIRGYSTLKPC